MNKTYRMLFIVAGVVWAQQGFAFGLTPFILSHPGYQPTHRQSRGIGATPPANPSPVTPRDTDRNLPYQDRMEPKDGSNPYVKKYEAKPW